VEQVVNRLSAGLKSQFTQWIRGLEIPDRSGMASKLLRLKTDALFLNFNYTPSLTKIYNIDPAQECHIHGSAACAGDELILGHAWNPSDRGSSNDGLDQQEIDTRVADGNRLIDSYFERTFKPTDAVIKAHIPFFTGLQGVREILVMGHSLGAVDHLYFREILRQIGGSRVGWRVSYYDDDALEMLRGQLQQLGVAEQMVEFARLVDI
jgi:hypothetical protein